MAMMRAKKIKDKTRHILVDTLGLLLLAVVHSPDFQDRDGGILLLATMRGPFRFLESCLLTALVRSRHLLMGLPRSCRVSEPRSSKDAINPKGSCSTQALDR
jgi:hypothetical protein